MQFITAISLFAAAVAAAPNWYPEPYNCPPGLYSVPQCCATDVLGVADLDCHTPDRQFWNAAQFKEVCASVGQQAKCCVVPVLGQALLCETPVGIPE